MATEKSYGSISRGIVFEKSGMSAVHCHDKHELYYMAKGSTTYYIGDKIYHIKEGDFAFIPKGILHKTDYETSQHNERVLLTFYDWIFTSELQAIREELCRSRIIYVKEDKRPLFEALLHQIEEEAKSQDKYMDFLINLHITELLVQLCRHKDDHKPALSGDDQTLYRISKYISTHFQDPITLDELSLIFSVSKSHLSRKFKEYTGIGINEYITYVRISNAEKLLKETTLPITQISAQCGYSDSNYFSTAFKKIRGITPKRYRTQHSVSSS